MIFLKRLLRSESESNLDYYDSIRKMPLINWWEFNETKDFGHLFKEYKEATEENIEALNNAYMALMDEFTKEFGISEYLLSVLEKQIEIAKLQADYMNGNKGNLTMIEVAQLELKDLVKTSNGMGFYEVKSIIEKQMGFRIDPNVTTVMEYYSYIRLIDGKKN